MSPPTKQTALRGAALSFKADPFLAGDDAAMHYESDGLILIDDGHIVAFGSYDSLRHRLDERELTHYRDALILPGFIDTHVHYPQTQIIAAYGKQLIDWLDHYVYAAEEQYGDPRHAAAVADFFLQECLRAGTTTASVYCTVHPGSVDAFFAAARQRRMRMIAGKVLMNRHAPAALQDTVRSGYDDSEALIRRWHGQDRLGYAITPRFAPSCTREQLESAGALWRAYPQTHVQSHVAENQAEVQWVKELFPERASYLDVYAHYGLTGPRSIYGHAIHLSEAEWRHLAESGSAVSHCPTSNSFLGSGLFNFARAKQAEHPIRVGLATDIGGGTSFSMLQTMSAAYKIAQLGHYPLSATRAFYLATRGAAQALYLDDKIGSIGAGMEADLLVLNVKSTALIDFRMRYCASLEEALFVQMILGDERATEAVYIAGELAYSARLPTTWGAGQP